MVLHFIFMLLTWFAHGASEVDASVSASEQSEIKMMVLNLANYDDWGDWPTRRNKIGDFILENKVDVLYFSEVRFDKDKPSTATSYMNMADQIVEYLLNHGIRCKIHTDPAMYYERRGHNSVPTENIETLWEGLTTITCNQDVRMATTEEMFLDEVPNSSDSNDRIAQYTRFEYNGTVFGCLNSHWSNDGNDRLLNAEETLARLDEWRDAANQPNILVGDLNAEMESPFDPSDSALMALKNAGWIDVYRMKYPDAKADPGYTLFYQREKRVDYVWANTCFYQAIRSVEIVGKREHDNPDDWWSDHFGILISVVPELFGTHNCTYTPADNEVVNARKKKSTSDSKEKEELRLERADQQILFNAIMHKKQPLVKTFMMIFYMTVAFCGLLLIGRWCWNERKRGNALDYNLMDENPELLAL